MACINKYQKSSLRAYNTATQSIGNVIFSNIGYQSGVSISLTAGSDTIYLKNPGLYYITADIDLSNSTAATNTSVQMYINGVALAGALTEATIITAGDVEPGSIAAVVPVSPQESCPCGKGLPVTFVISGTTATIENINVVIIKMA